MSELANKIGHPQSLKSAIAGGLAWVSQFVPNAPELTSELAQAWIVQLDGVISNEIVFDAFRIHVNRSKFWPSPAEIIAIGREIAAERQRKAEIDQTKALAAPRQPGPSISREERRAILSKMKPGAREYFLRVLGE